MGNSAYHPERSRELSTFQYRSVRRSFTRRCGQQPRTRRTAFRVEHTALAHHPAPSTTTKFWWSGGGIPAPSSAPPRAVASVAALLHPSAPPREIRWAEIRVKSVAQCRCTGGYCPSEITCRAVVSTLKYPRIP